MLAVQWFSEVVIPVGYCFVLGVVTVLLLKALRFVGLRYIADPFWRLLYPRPNDAFDTSIVWNHPWFRIGLVYIALYGLLRSGWFDVVFWGGILYGGYWVYRRYTSTKVPPTAPPAGGLTLPTQTGPIHLANPYRGVLIVGGAGSGKSKSLIEPLIQQAGAQGMAGLVYDFKFPTLANEVAGSYAQTSAITPYYVNFTDLNRSHRINPIDPALLASVSFAREAAVTVFANLDYKASQARNFWIQSAEVLLTGAIWYLRQHHPQQCSLPHAVSLILEADPLTLVKTLSQDEQTRGIIASVNSATGSENQLAGVFATIQNYLSVLNSPDIFWVLSGNDVPLDLNSPQTPSILVVGNDPGLSDTFSPLISLIVATALKRMNQPGRVPSMVVLDEAPTLFIPNFQQIPATARSNKVATVYAVQDVAQMEGTLGLQVSEMIISNLSNQFFGRTTNPKTAERVTRLFGKYDRAYETQSQQHSDHSSSIGRSYGIQQRDRLEAQEVMRFKTGEFAGLIAEGNQDEFRAQFIASPSKAIPIPSLNGTTPEQVTANYTLIRQQARTILTGGHPTTETTHTTSEEGANSHPSIQSTTNPNPPASTGSPSLDDLSSME
jgi:hypothetical protein